VALAVKATTSATTLSKPEELHNLKGLIPLTVESATAFTLSLLLQLNRFEAALLLSSCAQTIIAVKVQSL
jgi:hypothetical protein